MTAVFPPTAVQVTTLTPGYNIVSWLPATEDPYPLGGTDLSLEPISGHPIATRSTVGVIGRSGIPRQLSGDAAGSISFAGSVIWGMQATGSAVWGIGLADAALTTWGEGCGMSVNVATGNVSCYTSGGGGALSTYTGGTQRGATVTGLATYTAHRFRITVGADGNVKFELNGSTVFNAAGGLDLLSTAGTAVSVAVGLEVVTNARAAGLTALSVTYP